MTETDSPVLESGQLPVVVVHCHRNESDFEGLSTSVLLLPSRIVFSSSGRLREDPPTIKTSGGWRSVVKFADEITMAD